MKKRRLKSPNEAKPLKKIIKILLLVVGTVAAIIVVGIIIAVFFYKPQEETVQIEKGLIKQAADTIRINNCKMIGVGSPDLPGYPVPVSSKTDKTLKSSEVFRMFFYSIYPSYPAQAPGKEPEVLTPSIMAEFDLTGAGSCLLMISKESSQKKFGARFSPEVKRLSMSKFNAKEAEFYDALAKAAESFFSNTSDEKARKNANDFMDKFLYISEPGLKQFYYDLSPDFWNWIEQLTSRKLVKADSSAIIFDSYPG